MVKFIRNQETIAGQIDEEMVMVDIDKGNYFAFNAVATRIWELLETPRSMEELCGLLLEEYEVSLTQCRAEVERHLTKMEESSLIQQYA